MLLLLAVIAFGCKPKKIDFSGNQPVKINEFIAAFPLIETQFSTADSTLEKTADSTIISYTIFAQFIPDSSLKKLSVDSKTSIIQPVGRIEKQKEIYLIATFKYHKKIVLATFVLDKKYKFLASKELLNNFHTDDYNHFISINKEPTFLISQEKLNADKQLQFSRVGWVFNNTGRFMVVINDSNEDEKKNSVIINPIDTLAHKNKWSGNYVKNNKNFISLRDGKNINTYLFFIHFEKNDEVFCSGELKGVLNLKTPTTAIYSMGGDPCIIDFTFEGNTITVKEKGSCGNRRGMQCLFDDSFTRKKEIKPTHKK